MKSIQVNIKMPSNSELQSQMKQVIDYMGEQSNLELKLNTKEFNKSLSDMSSTLNKLKSELKNFGVLDNVINENKIKQSTKFITDQTEAIKRQQMVIVDGEKAIKNATVYKVDKNGDSAIVKELSIVQDKYKQIIQTVDTYNAKTGAHTGTTITKTDETEKNRLAQEKANDKLAEQISKEAQARLKLQESEEKALATQQDKLSKQIEYNSIIALANKELEEQANIQKRASDIQKLNMSSQPKLDRMSDNELISPSVVANLQNKLNNFNTNTAVKEIDEFKIALKNLSSSQPQIVRVQNAISNLEREMSLSQNKYGKLVKDEDIQKSVTEINKLKIALKSVTDGKTFDGASISKSINDANGSVKNLTTNAKESATALRLVKNDAMGLGSALKTAFSNAMMFAGVGSIMYGVANQFKSGISAVAEMDKAITDLSKVVDMSASQLDRMREKAVDMGKALGRSATDVAKAQAEFGRLYKDATTINQMTQSSIIGANVMDGISTDEVAKGLSTVIQSMKLEATDSMTIIDSMNEVQNNYRISADSMLASLSKVGSTAYTSGASLQQLEGYITAITVATGANGEEVGNSLKSLMSKVYKIGSEGIEDAGKSEEMLNSLGVAVRDSSGQFLKIDVVLKDLNTKWGTLNDTQKIATAQTVGG